MLKLFLWLHCAHLRSLFHGCGCNVNLTLGCICASYIRSFQQLLLVFQRALWVDNTGIMAIVATFSPDLSEVTVGEVVGERHDVALDISRCVIQGAHRLHQRRLIVTAVSGRYLGTRASILFESSQKLSEFLSRVLKHTTVTEDCCE